MADVDQSWPNSAKDGRCLPNCGRCEPRARRIRTNSIRSRPELANIAPRIRSESDRSGANSTSCESRPNSGCVRPLERKDDWAGRIIAQHHVIVLERDPRKYRDETHNAVFRHLQIVGRSTAWILTPGGVRQIWPDSGGMSLGASRLWTGSAWSRRNVARV